METRQSFSFEKPPNNDSVTIEKDDFRGYSPSYCSAPKAGGSPAFPKKLTALEPSPSVSVLLYFSSAGPTLKVSVKIGGASRD
jgi:hypothetical protein